MPAEMMFRAFYKFRLCDALTWGDSSNGPSVFLHFEGLPITSINTNEDGQLLRPSPLRITCDRRRHRHHKHTTSSTLFNHDSTPRIPTASPKVAQTYYKILTSFLLDNASRGRSPPAVGKMEYLFTDRVPQPDDYALSAWPYPALANASARTGRYTQSPFYFLGAQMQFEDGTTLCKVQVDSDPIGRVGLGPPGCVRVGLEDMLLVVPPVMLSD